MDINTENIKSQMRKGYLEYCILLILKKKAYAKRHYQGAERCQVNSCGRQLYPLLTRPEKQ